MPSRARDRLPPSKRQYVAQPLPGFIEFQHPKLVTAPPSGPRWLHEIKFDGWASWISSRVRWERLRRSSASARRAANPGPRA